MFLFVFVNYSFTLFWCYLPPCFAFRSSGSDRIDHWVRSLPHHHQPLLTLDIPVDTLFCVFLWAILQTLYLPVSLPHFHRIPYLLRRFAIHTVLHHLRPSRQVHQPSHLHSTTPQFHQYYHNLNLQHATPPLHSFTILTLHFILLTSPNPVATSLPTKWSLGSLPQLSFTFPVRTVSSCCWQPCRFVQKFVDLSFFGWKVSSWGAAGCSAKAKDWEVPAFYRGAQAPVNTALLNP